MAATARFDVVAIGNAIVDVLARADDALIERENLVKGSMRLIDADEAERLYAAMGPAIEMSGGSAANTLAGMAALGRRCGFIGQVADDQLGHVFTHDLTALGVAFDTPAQAGGAPTARCLILVTPDGQRTMNTFLGASQNLGRESLDAALIADADILYLEGYLWNADASRAAMAEAIGLAKAAGRRVAFTLSDTFVVAGHGEDFRRMTAAREIDILFANEAELLVLAQEDRFRNRARQGGRRCPLAGRDARRAWRGRGARTANAPRSRPSRSTMSSTRRVQATCSPRVSWRGWPKGVRSPTA